MNLSIIRHCHPFVLSSYIHGYIVRASSMVSNYEQQSYIAKLIETIASTNQMPILVQCLRETHTLYNAAQIKDNIAFYAPILSPAALISLLTELAVQVSSFQDMINTWLTPLSPVDPRLWNYHNAMIVWACIIDEKRIPLLRAMVHNPTYVDAAHICIPRTQDVVSLILAYRTDQRITHKMLQRVCNTDYDDTINRIVAVIKPQFAASYFMNINHLLTSWNRGCDTYTTPMNLERIANTFAIMERHDMLNMVVNTAAFDLFTYQAPSFELEFHSYHKGDHSLGSTIYALAILHADNYFKIRDDDNSKAARFFRMTAKLPLEMLQKILNPSATHNLLSHWMNNELLDHCTFYFSEFA